MTTPNEELLASLTQTNQFHESADICTADVIAVLQSQAERIKELERESETHSKAYGLAIVERDNLRHELKVAQEGWRCECSTDDACRFARERDALRAELAAIAAIEPVAYRWVWKSKPHDIEGWCYTSTPPNSPELQEIEKLFTSPMPAQRCSYCDGTWDVHSIDGEWRGKCLCAQDVTELVGALQLFAYALPLDKSTVKTCYAVTNQMRDAAHAALSKYKGAK